MHATFPAGRECEIRVMQLVITSTGTDVVLSGWDGMGELCCKGMLGGTEERGAVLCLLHF